MHRSGLTTGNSEIPFRPRRKCANYEQCKCFIESYRHLGTILCQDCSNKASRQRLLAKNGYTTWAQYMRDWRSKLMTEERRRQWREQKCRSRKAHREREQKRQAAA